MARVLMNTTACDIQDVSFSLTGVLHYLMRTSGHSVAPDDLHAVLGLPLMICASADVPAPRWPSLARDAFLPQACQLFGITVRDLHPPEAARGLEQAEAFEQHFAASYLPHIERAIENGQSVLAWQGWTGLQGGWGILNQICSQGVCAAGPAFPGLLSEADSSPEPETLSRPPLQVYVIETNEPVTPDANSLFDMSMTHLKQAWSPAVGDRFGVLVAASAAEHWLRQATVSHESWDASINVASSWLSGSQSFMRFLQRHEGQLTPENGSTADTIGRHVMGLQGMLQNVLAWPRDAGSRIINMQDAELSDLIIAVHDLQCVLGDL